MEMMGAGSIWACSLRMQVKQTIATLATDVSELMTRQGTRLAIRGSSANKLGNSSEHLGFQSCNQSIIQSIDRSIIRSIDQSIAQSIEKSINRSIDQ